MVSAGDVVTCENDHEIARWIRTPPEIGWAAALEFTGPLRLDVGEPMRPCPVCGCHWQRIMTAGGRVGMVVLGRQQFHIRGKGWV